VEHPAVKILNSNRVMAISTVRPDGWPQTTIVGYANRGFELVFMIYRSSQKFANIGHDDRISIAVSTEPKDINELQAVYAGAHASQIADQPEREAAWRLLMERHSNLSGFNIPDESEAVFIKARCKYVSVLDFTQGIGHREQLVIDDEGVASETQMKDEWGPAASG
jgi:nitroimidazol reductase NimA-like FMN-containing flavoprotein (pyridoxamine 5'-phosphate oxidase superfamily)